MEKYKRGNFSVVFPPGTYRPPGIVTPHPTLLRTGCFRLKIVYNLQKALGSVLVSENSGFGAAEEMLLG